MLSPEDRRAIRELADDYALLVDSRDYEGVAGLFLPDGCLVAPDPPAELGPVRELPGQEAIRRELSRLDDFTLTFHGVLGLLATSTAAGTASGEVNAVAHHVLLSERGAQDLTWHLRYSDQYARAAEGWRFARREITIKVIDARRVRVADRAPGDGPAQSPARGTAQGTARGTARGTTSG